MENKALVSVIVPVYNVGPYLERCLDSLAAQTLKEIEIILIDDGSTDGSGTVCDSYAREDERFRVIHKKNEGLSAARNDGIDAAKANYIMFADSDDWVEPQFCEIPYSIAAASGADMVMFYHQNYSGGVKLKMPPPIYKEGQITSQQAVDVTYSSEGNYAWNKLYERSLFEGIRYPAGQVYEDIITTCRIVDKAKRIWLSHQVLYNYRFERPGAITSEKSREMFRIWLGMNRQKQAFLKERGYAVRGCVAKEILKLLDSNLQTLIRSMSTIKLE